MKKIISGILTLAMLLALGACGGGGGDTGAADNSDWAYIEGKGEMIIGITYFEPMNYLDDKGALTGFETEFATAVCESLGVTPVFQEINWAAKETELSAKNIDCIWNGMTITEERLENMSVSRPYMENKQVLVVSSGNVEAMAASVEGLTIVAEAGSAGETVCQEEEFFVNAKYTPVDAQSKALMEVAAGTADGCVIDYVMSIGMIGEGTDYADLVAIGERGFGAEEYGVALRKEDKELTAKVNESIEQLIENGKLKEIADKYKLSDLLITD